MAFQKAVKGQAYLRMALIGPSGAGKTYSALRIACALGGRVGLIDTERKSSSHYANRFNFDLCPLYSYSVEAYIAALHEAEDAGFDVLIIDSLSHAWAGKDGVLEFVDKRAKQTQSGNSFGAWRDATPKHNELIDTLLSVPMHLIITMRAKMEYVQEKDDKGRTVIRKVGLQPIQRDNLEYEFDVVGDIGLDHDLRVSKTRFEELVDGYYTKPGEDVAAIIKAALAGEPLPERPRPQPRPT
ncbi:MAG: ATP-binding protein, partial [Chloroflexi bacterium]|nr:ATP-binding protein [Chloroflexota bacterium]